jgi:cytochrome c-type biogenesis protein CcsB
MTQNFSVFQANLCNIAFLVSLCTTLYYWVNTIFFSQRYKLGFFSLLSVNILLALQLIFRWVESGHFPLSSLYESLLFLGWGICTIYLVIEYVTKNQFIGVLVSPILTFILGFTGFSLPPELQAMKPLVPALQSNWLFMHVSVMMLSYAGLLVGSLMSIAFVVMYTTLAPTSDREKQNDLVNPFQQTARNTEPVFETRLDPEAMLVSMTRDVLSYETDAFSRRSLTASEDHRTAMSTNVLNLFDNISYRTIGIGFCLLTLGILSGAVWANETWGSYWSWDPKETWALITWLTFAVYLHMRFLRGWSGIKPAWIASIGFVLIWVCYLGVNLLGKGLHSYGFFS